MVKAAQHPGPGDTECICLQAAGHHPTQCASPMWLLPPSLQGVLRGGVLTVTHALKEVFEGFSQLPRLQDGGTGTCFDQVPVFSGGRSFPPTQAGKGGRIKSLTCVTWGSPPESAICRGERRVS